LGYNARRGNGKILHTVLREKCGIETDRRGCLPAARIIPGTGKVAGPDVFHSRTGKRLIRITKREQT